VSVSPDALARLAELAALELERDEMPALAAQLADILEYVAQLEAVQTNGSADFRPGPSSAPLRDDHLAPIPMAGDLERFAPMMRDGLFLVPRLDAVGDEG
jgi:aspartyl-tRNA(Asn)/glutamyl-tRNA(Gln) amidotransferase subunit C